MDLRRTFTECMRDFSNLEIDTSSQQYDRDSLNSLLESTTRTGSGVGDSDFDVQRRYELARRLLGDVVRPAFSKNKNKNVTAQGRKAMETWRPPVPYDSDDIKASKPWKYEDTWVEHIFTWCLDSLDESAIEDNWPMVIPPILSYIDDNDTAWRIKGCELLQKLLRITPHSLLERTGLTPVFEESLFPYLMHLPPLTEESETLTLLPVVYNTLLQVIRSRFPEGAPREGWQKSLDKVIRYGIHKGLNQVSDNIAVGRLLLGQMSTYVAELGNYFVKHLKIAIPLLNERMAGPFATASPAHMLDATLALKAILLNAWQRVPYWHMQITEILCVAWMRILQEESTSQGLKDVKHEILECVKIFKAIMAVAKGDGEVEVRKVLEAEEKLSALLDTWNAKV